MWYDDLVTGYKIMFQDGLVSVFHFIIIAFVGYFGFLICWALIKGMYKDWQSWR